PPLFLPISLHDALPICFPAGLPRTMVADLSGRLPSGTRCIRIRTNLQIYWDQILVDRTASMDSIRVAPVPVASAELRFHGYPRQDRKSTRLNSSHLGIS